jgi:hypothetical protein
MHVMIVTDSRGKKFADFDLYNSDFYSTELIVCRGAVLQQLQTKTISALKSVPSNETVLIVICAGINELTFRDKHKGGVELIASPRNDLLQNLLNYKRSVIAARPNTLVAFGTIATTDLKQVNSHYSKIGKLRQNKYNEELIANYQEQIDQELRYINHMLFEENKKAQILSTGKRTSIPQLYLHQYVQRVFSKKKANGERLIKRRISPNALCDGLHPTNELAKKWYRAIHQNCMKIWKAIQ